MLLPFAVTRQQGRFGLTHRSDDRAEAFGERLSCKLIQFWFWIEKIDVAGTSFHEEKDHAFGAPEVVRWPRCCWRCDRVSQKVSQGQGAEACSAFGQELAPRERLTLPLGKKVQAVAIRHR